MKKTINEIQNLSNGKCQPLSVEETKAIKGGCGCDLRRPPRW